MLLLLFIPVCVFSESLFSPTWGFSVDLPEGYDYIEGDAKNRFSFEGPGGILFDMLVYDGTYKNMEELVTDVNRRLGNKGEVDFFTYRNKQAAIIELNFGSSAGWGLCVELAAYTEKPAPMLLALSYSLMGEYDFDLFHMSVLDSIIPSDEERYYPGPIMEYSFPRGKQNRVPLAMNGVSAMISENDAEAAQVLIEREYMVLANYLYSEYLQQAWIRYYRMVYRDSSGRISDAASALVRNWGGSAAAQRDLAQKALSFVQGFKYERHPEGSDFVNLVTAITEGRGDCDSRAMLWAIILSHADIRAAMMVSYQHSHALGLADIAGVGARFEEEGTRWLVAETTADVDLGLIPADMSDTESWIGVIFDKFF